MNKVRILTLLILVALLGGWYWLAVNQGEEVITSSPLNATYIIEEESFALVDGSAEKELSLDSVTKNKVSVFGEPVFGDVDGDGDLDAVVILVNNSGGSGTFYYGAIAVNIDGEYQGTDTILLGDRIIPQSFYVENNRAIINYVTRAPGDSFATEPSIEKILHLQFDPENMRLIQIAVDFEGEANPDIMTLDMKTWKWVKTIYNNDTELVLGDPDAFTLTFADGNFSATTDCNSMSGAYSVENNSISFDSIITTLMFCEGSQEQEFSAMLNEVQSFFFTSKGELVFDLKFDSGSAIFQ